MFYVVRYIALAIELVSVVDVVYRAIHLELSMYSCDIVCVPGEFLTCSFCFCFQKLLVLIKGFALNRAPLFLLFLLVKSPH